MIKAMFYRHNIIITVVSSVSITPYGLCSICNVGSALSFHALADRTKLVKLAAVEHVAFHPSFDLLPLFCRLANRRNQHIVVFYCITLLIYILISPMEIVCVCVL